MISLSTAFKHASIFVIALVPVFACAQRSTTLSSSSSIVIVQSTAIYKTNDMQFGLIVPGPLGGTVVLSTSGTRTKTGSILLPSGGSASAAGFALLGAPSTSFSISYPSSVTLNRVGGSDSMTVTAIVASPSSGGTLSAGGSATVKIGGTLTVSPTQTFGQYSGSFNVTVSYP